MIASIWCKNVLGHLSLDIICSSKLTVFLELCSREIVRFLEQIMSADKYPSIFSCHMEAIVYIYHLHLFFRGQNMLSKSVAKNKSRSCRCKS